MVVVKVSTKQIGIQIELANKGHEGIYLGEWSRWWQQSRVPFTLSLITSTNAWPSQSFVLRRKAIEAKTLTEREMGKMKLHEKPGKSTKVKINIGIMTKREDVLVLKRVVTLPVTVRTSTNKHKIWWIIKETSLIKQCPRQFDWNVIILFNRMYTAL